MLNTKNNLKNAIDSGTKFLYTLINEDKGILYHHEDSPCSGIWVTAEALEFLLTSKNISRTGTDFNNINSMVKFIVDSQNHDGSWNVLKNGNGNEIASSISTGHCVYALKLALCTNYITNDNPFDRIYKAIKNGETWLLNNCRQANNTTFWKTGVKQAGESFEIDSEGLRIEFVFTTFYAMLGFVIPDGYISVIKENSFNDWVQEENEKDSIKKFIMNIINFFSCQATYFYNTYREKKLDINIFSQIASTISRIFGGLKFLGGKIEIEVENGLKKILLSNIDEAYYTSALRVEVDTVQENSASYNNNTPFDIAIALFNFDVEYSYIKPIVTKFLDEQKEDGFWYLNFTSIPGKIKAWSTIEALMVIERALNYKQNTHLKNKVLNFIRKVIKRRLAFTFIGLFLAVITMSIFISISFKNQNPEFSFWETTKSILGCVFIPLLCGILLDIICKKFKNK